MPTIELASNTSSIVSRRGVEWSSSIPDPRSRLTITFPHPWDTHSGPAFDWYNQQPYTRFSTIEHRKTRDAPFFHEFLLIQLEGGYICRIERTGDGSSLDALRRRGSLAHDLIQCYPSSSPFYQQDQETSDIISEVHFPCELDLVDILAVFFAIHRGESSQKYTLTRYNCYFICWAVLGVLSRGVSKWHSAVTPETQDDILDKALQTLFDPAQPSLPGVSEHSIVSRICSMLQIDYGFILNALREELHSDSIPPYALRDALAGAFWSSNWTGFLNLRFEHLVSKAAEVSFEHSDMHPGLKKTLSEDLPTAGSGAISRLFRRAAHGLENMDKVKHAAAQYRKTLASENQASFFRQLKQNIRSGYIATKTTARVFRNHRERFGTFYKIKSILRLTEFWTLEKSVRDIVWHDKQALVTDDKRIPPDILRYEENQSNIELAQSLDTLQSTSQLKPRTALVLDEVKRIAKDSTDGGRVLWAKWIGVALCISLERSISEIIRIDQVATVSMSNINPGGGPTHIPYSIIDFQNHLKDRIKKRARRVEQNSLGQENRLIRDIEYELAQVRASMPREVGTLYPTDLAFGAWGVAGGVIGLIAGAAYLMRLFGI